jgi:hypothetical protein
MKLKTGPPTRKKATTDDPFPQDAKHTRQRARWLTNRHIMALLRSRNMIIATGLLSILSSNHVFAFSSVGAPHLLGRGGRHHGLAQRGAVSFSTSGALNLRSQKRATIMQAQGSKANEASIPAPPSPLRKFGLLALWASFGAYIIFGSPSGDAQVEGELLKQLLSFPPGDKISSV